MIRITAAKEWATNQLAGPEQAYVHAYIRAIKAGINAARPDWRTYGISDQRSDELASRAYELLTGRSW